MIQNDQKEGKNTFFTINMNLNLEQRIQNTDAIHSLEPFFSIWMLPMLKRCLADTLLFLATFLTAKFN